MESRSSSEVADTEQMTSCLCPTVKLLGCRVIYGERWSAGRIKIQCEMIFSMEFLWLTPNYSFQSIILLFLPVVLRIL